MLLFVLVVARPSVAAQNDEIDIDAAEHVKALYGKYLNPVTSFGYIYATRYHSGTEKKSDETLGFDIDDEMTDFLQLRYRNNFADIPYKENLFKTVNHPEVARLECATWLQGDSYPMAYHVECKLGAGKKSRIVTDATLGITSPSEADRHIKSALDRMVSRFALIFFRARGEL